MAFDPKKLGNKVAVRLLVAAQGVVGDAAAWINESVKETPTPFDDLLLPVVSTVEIWGVKKLGDVIAQFPQPALVAG